jgi:archaellum biogenesis ATPase FlaH
MGAKHTVDGSNPRRFNESVIEVGIVSLDYDTVESGAWEQAKSALETEGLEYVMYTSASHTKEKPRFRVVLSLSGAAKPFQLKYYVDYVTDLIGLPFDSGSYEKNRLFFYGGVFATAKDYTAIYSGDKGVPLDWVACNPPQAPVLVAVQKEDFPIETFAKQYSQKIADDYLAVLPNTEDMRQNWLTEIGGFNYAGCSNTAILNWSAKYDDSKEASEDCLKALLSFKNRTVSLTAQAMLKARFEQFTHNTLDDFNVVKPTPYNSATNRFPVTDSNDYMKGYTGLSWIVKKFLPKAQLGIVYGASGSGKTFWVLDLAATIARGGEYRGMKVKANAVCYIASEARSGVMKRLAGFDKEHGPTKNLQIIGNAPNLLDAKHANEIIQSLLAQPVKASLIIIDTLAASHNGDENTSTDMGNLINECKRISDATDALVLLVHHTGKDDKMRGSSTLYAASDIVIRISGDSSGHKVEIEKQKDGEVLPPMGFTLNQVTLDAVDEDGDAITTCVVKPSELTETTKETKETDKKETMVEFALSVFNSISEEEITPKKGPWMSLTKLAVEVCKLRLEKEPDKVSPLPANVKRTILAATGVFKIVKDTVFLVV